jgi:CubicO group peptidase (beta-lactamase class C family)
MSKEESMTFAHNRVCLFATVFLLLLAAGLFAAPTEEASTEDAAAVAAAFGPTDPAELEAFIDGMMAAHMPSRDIPAATIAVVKDGELFFAKGYGYADREKKIPVKADTTLFRPGSTSKLFTWTAVMQLAERGQLDLDADVNTYLTSFQIPATYPEPITMKHLLTHTAGFEDGSLGYLIVKDRDKLMGMREALEAHMPERVRPPGTWSSYSNWGTALAGLIVEEISGMSFAEYVEKNIFVPLQMNHSTFREPLPEDLAPDMAVGYRWKNGLYEPGYFELISDFGPAGALSSTATDMANFMIAHLQLGRFGDQRILEEETARQMHSQLYTPDPRLPGMDYGFYESDVLGQHVIGHGGDTVFFHSDLALFPEYNEGLFVSYVAHGGRARWELVEAFVRRYLPHEEPEVPEPPEDFAERAKKYAGNFRFTRHNWSDLEKIISMPNVIKVVPTKDNTLMTTGILEDPWHWVEVEPNFFQQIDGDLTLAFIEDENGKINHMAISLLPFMPAYRIAWYASPNFNYFVLAVGLLLCVTTLISAFRHRKARKEDPSRARWAVRLAWLVSALTLIFWIAVVIIVSSAGEDLFSGFPPTLTAALMLPIVITVLTIGVAVFAVLVWKGGYWTRFRRIHYTLFAIFAIGLVWFYWYWNVLGVQYG